MRKRDIFYKMWSIPRRGNDSKHSASLLDLFFDLVLVAFLGGATHGITHMFQHGHEFNLFNFMFITLALISIITIWRNFTFYSYRYESLYGIRYRFATFMLMLGLIFATAAQYMDMGHNNEHFFTVAMVNIAGFVTTMITLLYLYISGYFFSQDKYDKKSLLRNSIGIIIMMLFWMPALIIAGLDMWENNLIAYTAMYPFWVIGLAIWWTMDWFSRSSKILVNKRDMSIEYLQERFGIVFIVFIGECIIQVVVGSATNFENNPLRTILILVAGFAMLFMWWTFYNDTINYPDVINHPNRINLYSFAMLGILLSLSATSVGLSLIIEHPNQNEGKLFLGTAMIIWQTSNAIILGCMKNFNKRDKAAMPKIMRTLIYTAPISVFTYAWMAYTPFVSSEAFLFVGLGVSIAFTVSLLVISFIEQYKQANNNYEEFYDQVKKFYNNEHKWIRNTVLKHGDIEHHRKADFKLNKYSKYLEPDNSYNN